VHPEKFLRIGPEKSRYHDEEMQCEEVGGKKRGNEFK